MSRHNALMAASALRDQPNYVEERFAVGDGRTSGVIEALSMLSKADPIVEIARQKEMMQSLPAMMDLPGNDNGQDKPFAFAPVFGGVAIIPIYGLLIARFPYCWGFVTGYNFIQNQLRAALEDDDVKMIVFDVNSGGGMSIGCEELSAEIYASRSVKPSVAIVQGGCYSAAYYIASAATQMWASISSGVGSIGTYCVRYDFTGAMAQDGVKATVIFAGDNKLDSNSLVPLSDGAKDRLQNSVDQLNDMFVASVARNRSEMTVESVRATKASCYSATDALSAKLIDGVGTAEYALGQASTLVTDPEDDEDLNPDTEDDPMAFTAEQQAAVDAAVATRVSAESATAATAAVAAERERFNGILNCAEAKDRPALARTLASQDISVAVAQTILASAAVETKAAAAPTVENPLDDAMNRTKQPNVEQDNRQNVAAGTKQLTLAAKMCQMQDATEGTKSFEALEKKGLAYETVQAAA